MLSNLAQHKNRRPRFNLSFRLIELINLPQLSGSCYVKWSIKDNIQEPVSKALSSSAPNMPGSVFLPPTQHPSGTNSLLPEAPQGLNSVNGARFGKPLRGTTANHQIENHKVKFNTVQDVINIKFEANKKIRDRFIQLENKYLILTVYSEVDSSAPSSAAGSTSASIITSSSFGSSQKRSTAKKVDEIVHNNERRTYLGQVKINLVNYIFKNYDTKASEFSASIRQQNLSVDKYLLQDSKINSILSISIKLDLVKGDYHDFANQLYLKNGVYEPPRASPAVARQHADDSMVLQDLEKPRHEGTFISNVKETVHATLLENGIGNLRNSHSKEELRKPSGQQHRNSSSFLHHDRTRPSSKVYDTTANRNSESQPATNTVNSGNRTSTSRLSLGDRNSLFSSNTAYQDNNRVPQQTINLGDDSNINNIELITDLYYKTFKVLWDERPNEFNPKECVDDIFKGGNGWKRTIDGVNLIDLNYVEHSQLHSNGNQPDRRDTAATEQSEAQIRTGSTDHYNIQRNGYGHDYSPSETNSPNMSHSVPQIFLSGHSDTPNMDSPDLNSPDMDQQAYQPSPLSGRHLGEHSGPYYGNRGSQRERL